MNKQLVILEQKEAFLRSNLVEEIFNPLKNEKVQKIKNNIQSLYEKAVQKLHDQRTELLKKIDSSFQENTDLLQKRIGFDYTNIAKNTINFKRKLRLSLLKVEKYEGNEEEVLEMKKQNRL